MATHTSYTQARSNFAQLCNRVTRNREIVIVNRRGGESVALVSADELNSLLETAHLLRSPRNARRLLSALKRARGRTPQPTSIEKLRRELGVERPG
jgi:antitoxin YefM